MTAQRPLLYISRVLQLAFEGCTHSALLAALTVVIIAAVCFIAHGNSLFMEIRPPQRAAKRTRNGRLCVLL